MSSIAVRTKTYIKRRAARFVQRYDVGRRLIRVLIAADKPSDFEVLESAISDLKREAGVIVAISENSAKMTADLEERILETSGALKILTGEVHEIWKLTANLSGRIDHLAENMTALADLHLAENIKELADLSMHLRAMPYMSDPSLFSVSRDNGEKGLGFRSAKTEGGDLYRAFEDIFRGPESLIRERQRFYLEIVRGKEPVVDLGCGRGEMLSLLREAGIAGEGVDLDEGMVNRCKEKNLEVAHLDALEYLGIRPDNSLGTVFAAQVIEHLPYEDLMELLRLAHQKLRSGGVLVAETVNPHSIRALKTFWVDLTHQKPIFPETLLALCRNHMFQEAEVVFPNGTGDLENDLQNEGEYAVIATKG